MPPSPKLSGTACTAQQLEAWVMGHPWPQNAARLREVLSADHSDVLVSCMLQKLVSVYPEVISAPCVPLYWACQSDVDRSASIATLMKAGAELDVEDTENETALHALLWSRQSESVVCPIAQLFMKQQPDICHMKGCHRRTPLHCAFARPDSTAALLRSGANARATDQRGQTALHMAVQHPNVLRVLLRHVDTPVCHSTYLGMYALHKAAAPLAPQPEAISIFLRHLHRGRSRDEGAGRRKGPANVWHRERRKRGGVSLSRQVSLN